MNNNNEYDNYIQHSRMKMPPEIRRRGYFGRFWLAQANIQEAGLLVSHLLDCIG